MRGYALFGNCDIGRAVKFYRRNQMKFLPWTFGLSVAELLVSRQIPA